MPLFNRDIARIYIDESQDRIDPTVIPVFPPDTSLDVGDFVAMDGGQLVRRGNLGAREGMVLDIREDQIAPQSYASAGKVSLGTSVIVPSPTGNTLAKTTLTFRRGRGVATSFRAGVQRSIEDADAFGDALMQLYAARRLNAKRYVVWSVRRVDGGTVVVSEEGDNQVEILADASMLGPAGVTWADLALGVDFGSERKATWKLSSRTVPLVSSVRLLGLSKDQRRVVDGFGFEPDRRPNEADIADLGRPKPYTAVDILKMI